MGQPINQPTNNGFSRRRARAFKIRRDTTRPGVTGEDGIKSTAEGHGIETAQIIPDRGRGEVPRALGGDEDCAWVTFPLDKCAGVKTGLGEHDAQIQASAASAEGQSVPGT